MRVLVDTCVWSLALRRDAAGQGPPERELRELVREGRVAMVGPIRQELLSGVRSESHFKQLRGKLRAFGDVGLERADHEEAALCFNRCRAAGIQGGSVDFLLCAIAIRRKLAIYTTDADFDHYAKVLQIKLHEVRPELG